MADESPEGSRDFSAPSTRTPTEPGNLSVTSPASSGDDSAESIQQGRSSEQTGVAASTAFEFISGRDDDSRRRARSHVMRDFMRKKRSRGPEASRGRSEGGNTLAAGGSSRSLTTRVRRPGDLSSSVTAPHHIEHEQESAAARSGPGFGLAPEPFSSAYMQAELTQPALLSPAPGRWSRSTTSNEEAARALLAAENPDPQSRIGGGNADPFDSLSYPLVMNAADHQLLHHYITTMPAMMFQAVNLDLVNPWKDFFQNLGHSNALVLQSLLAFSAMHLASLHGQDSTIQSITHKSRLIRMLNENLRASPPRNPQGSLYAIQELAAIENRWGNMNVAPMHFEMVRRLIKAQGGMKAVHQANRSLEMAVHCTDLVLLPNVTRGRGLIWDSRTSSTIQLGSPPAPNSPPPYSTASAASIPQAHPPPCMSTPADLSDTDDLRLACEQFIMLLRSVSELADETRQQYRGLNPQFETWSTPMTLRRVDTFAPGSPLYRLLTSTSSLNRQGVGRATGPEGNLTEDICCMYSLIYLNTVVAMYKDNPRDLDTYLKELSVSLVSNELDWNHSVEMLAVVLMSQELAIEQQGEPGWTLWSVGRMLRVAKRLGRAMWDRVKARFLRALVVNDSVLPELGDPAPDDEELRKEILGNLYVGRLALR